MCKFTFRQGVHRQKMNQSGSFPMAQKRDPTAIAAEVVYVTLNPVQRGNLWTKEHRRLLLARGRTTGTYGSPTAASPAIHLHNSLISNNI